MTACVTLLLHIRERYVTQSQMYVIVPNHLHSRYQTSPLKMMWALKYYLHNLFSLQLELSVH